ncbi:MAG TPA: lipopolysaccharide heptosyltransferase II [Pyrinomonadaceae bacterium]|nr:lipopolysaccharide heptosyltransferase II [Pyrinomonadaceae bacterium]
MRKGSIQTEGIRRVVVRGTNWVGDAIMTIPALRELRRVLPLAHITLATRPWAEGLFRDADFLDEILIYERPRRSPGALLRQVREWRSRSFDLAILFQNAFEAAVIAGLARVPVRVGYATDGRRPLLTHPLALPLWRSERHEVFYYMNIVSELEQLLYGASDVDEREPRFVLGVSEERKRDALQMLSQYGSKRGRKLIALCPGSTNSRAKRWPAERFAALADRLVEEMKADVLLIGSRDEMQVSQEVARLMTHEPVMLTGETDLAQLTAALSVVDLLVTNDTGPAHIAAALGRPTLVIFGPTDPRTTRPFSASAEVVRRPPDCAPCMLRDCPIDHRCMTGISHEEVYARAARMLSMAQVEVGA